MKNINTKSLLMTPKEFYTDKAFREQTQQWTENQVLLKKTIELFFQSTPIVDFDPAEQFQKIQKIPISQDKFCILLAQVVFKKTKDKIDWAKNFLIIKSKKPNPVLEPEENLEQQLKLEPLKINRYKFLVDILANIKMSCSRLEQLLYKMLDLHEWDCQSKNNCKQKNYMEGYLAKLLFKKIIIPSGIFDPEQAFFRDFICQDKQEKPQTNQNETKEIKELRETKESETAVEKKWAKESDVYSLKNQIARWGTELLQEFFKEKPTSNSLDQKTSENKYFICRQCFIRDNNIETNEAPKKKNKKKNKNKTNALNTSGNANLDLSQEKNSNDPSRKSSAIEIEDQTTAEDVDQELQYETEKYYEKVSNFLEDFKIDLENRFEIRLKRSQSSDDEGSLPEDRRENRLLNRVRSILYKSHPNLN